MIVTGDANACPCGVNEKTSLSAVSESGGASLATATVIDVGASSAPAGTTTLAPPADTVPPAGPIEAVDEVAAGRSDGASAGEPSWDEFDAGDDEHAATKIPATTAGDRRKANEDMAHRNTAARWNLSGPALSFAYRRLRMRIACTAALIGIAVLGGSNAAIARFASLDREAVRRVFRRHEAPIKDCYEQQLEKDRKLRGRLAVTLTIDGNGRVSAAEITESQVANEALPACTRAAVRKWSSLVGSHAIPDPQ